jgi:hypothetical protein
MIGKDGYGYSQPVTSLNLIALYRCTTGHDQFVSTDPNCEGETTDDFSAMPSLEGNFLANPVGSG